MKDNLKSLIFLAAALLIAGGGYLVLNQTSTEETVSTAQYTDNYTDLDTFQAEPERFANKRQVYFFHATWCSTCKALENSIVSNQGSIPNDVVFIKTDYDTQLDLREKYGVFTQHTLVQIRDDGTIIGKWTGQPSISAVLEDLQETT